jgi:hypothetical protein
VSPTLASRELVRSRPRCRRPSCPTWTPSGPCAAAIMIGASVSVDESSLQCMSWHQEAACLVTGSSTCARLGSWIWLTPTAATTATTTCEDGRNFGLRRVAMILLLHGVRAVVAAARRATILSCSRRRRRHLASSRPRRVNPPAPSDFQMLDDHPHPKSDQQPWSRY